MRNRLPMLWACLLVAACCAATGAFAVGEEEQATREVEGFCRVVGAFHPVRLPATGTLALTPEQSLTIDTLHNVPRLDLNPPVLLDHHPPTPGEAPKPTDPRMTDDFPPGKAPYVAKGIAPFRFRYFHNEFNYGGWHNWAMCEYAMTHGFSILSSYNRKPDDWPRVAAGTKWLSWGGFVDWHKWLPAHGIPDGRLDQLMDLDVTAKLVEEQVFKPGLGFDYLMIDMEHGLLRPEQLRQQDWYPKGAPEAERAAFEKKYYDGYARTYIAPVQAARKAGYGNISLYGWQPFGRTYFGLDKIRLDPLTDFAWNAYGKQIYDAVDLLNPSVYCFYWTPQNVAYTLANIDLNMTLVRTTTPVKPVRPYFWTLLHGGGGGWRWWSGQPLAYEEARAMTTLALFTGIDGVDQWNWSGTGNHHVPPELKPEADVMVAAPFTLKPEGQGGAERHFVRYDVLHIVSAADGIVRFRWLDKADVKGSTADTAPVYAMKQAELTRMLRARSEPVAAVIEGLALAWPFETILRFGEVKVDVPAQEQFGKTLPIVRRVKLGKWHVLATYDPGCVYGGPARTIELKDFDGRAGRTVTLPADAQTRIFVLEQ
ncbi:MAG: hypothetical protein KKI08_02400 [Armatimonadetes bacterium]|nr:hypothetical protein [Armatimonadota bacterium]